MKTIKVGVIGTGVGIRTLIPAFRQLSNVDIVAISGSSKERSEYFATKLNISKGCSSYKEICENKEIDLVCVASPNNYHYLHTQYALECEKNVLCEKPLVIDKTELESIIDISNTSKKICIIDHQLRFNPYMRWIKDALDSGHLGKCYYIRIHQQSTGFSNYDAPWSWSFDAAEGGGVRNAMCSHFADLLLFWFNSDFYNVFSHLDPVYKTRVASDGTQRDINASTFCNVSCVLQNDIKVDLSVTAGACSSPRFDISIYGDNGELHFDLDKKITFYSIDKKGIAQSPIIDNVYKDEQNNQVSIFSGSFRYYAPQIINAIAYSDSSFLKDAARFKDARYTFDFLESIKSSANTTQLVKPALSYNNYV